MELDSDSANCGVPQADLAESSALAAPLLGRALARERADTAGEPQSERAEKFISCSGCDGVSPMGAGPKLRGVCPLEMSRKPGPGWQPDSTAASHACFGICS
eukprot:4930241-Pleurochrysis_carterae.AAC.2